MRSRDYTRELHLKPTSQRVPVPVTVLVWLAVAAVGFWMVRQVAATGPAHESGGQPPAVASMH
jgi:hypothetical protein